MISLKLFDGIIYHAVNWHAKVTVGLYSVIKEFNRSCMQLTAITASVNATNGVVQVQ